MYTCVCVCVYIHTYVYMHIHTIYTRVPPHFDANFYMQLPVLYFAPAKVAASALHLDLAHRKSRARMHIQAANLKAEIAADGRSAAACLATSWAAPRFACLVSGDFFWNY